MAVEARYPYKDQFCHQCTDSDESKPSE